MEIPILIIIIIIIIIIAESTKLTKSGSYNVIFSE
jgi:hypothetical protein